LEPLHVDLTVIGAGMTGMAATLFAVNRGLSVAQVGRSSEIGLASGLFDLLGVHPISEGKGWDDPWAGMKALVHDFPQHPYGRLRQEDIRTAFDELLDFLEGAGLPYSRRTNRNARVVTPLGTLKTTYCTPQTMWAGVEAFERKSPGLIVDFSGLKGFNAGLMTRRLQKDWPGLRAARISFPGLEHLPEILPEQMANALVLTQNLRRLAQAVRPLIEGAECVGLPAVLGMYRSPKVVSELTEWVGVPIFEIFTIPPSIPGVRLKEAFERGLREKGLVYFSRERVLNVQAGRGGEFKIDLSGPTGKRIILSPGIILATGRFIGGGLGADRKHLFETIFDLPVYQPENRIKWHREDFFDRRGHLINQAGLEIDDNFRPIDINGRPAFESLFAAGSILAHQDWKRMKCGTGLAAGTAFGAVKAFIEVVKNEP
jgi:glycerol-3-phosphate dehydrogenase subunit B